MDGAGEATCPLEADSLGNEIGKIQRILLFRSIDLQSNHEHLENTHPRGNIVAGFFIK